MLAGDSVLIAPVSGQIPCKQGILQRKCRFCRLGDGLEAKEALQCSHILLNSLLPITAKIIELTAYSHDVTGNSEGHLDKRPDHRVSVHFSHTFPAARKHGLFSFSICK